MKSFQNFSAPASARTLSISIRSHTHAEACIFDVQHQMTREVDLSPLCIVQGKGDPV